MTPLEMEVHAPGEGSIVRYTLDGSEPDSSDALYEGALVAEATSILRARCFEPGKLPSPVATSSYLFEVASEMPVLSLVTDPANLWDVERGIYVLGDEFEPVIPYYGANFWQDWERSAHLEFWEANGEGGFAQDLGIKIHGNWTRAYSMKSLRLTARESYGQDRIDYPVFEDYEVIDFKHLLLRNGGNDWSRAHFRDALAQGAASDWDLDTQAYRAVVLYLNGAYWGIHNIRERLNGDYLASHHGTDPDGVDILERAYNIVAGDSYEFLVLIDYIDDHDADCDSCYARVRELIEVENFATWNIFEIFFGNTDWPGNNNRYWRPQVPGGRWRWFLFDLDLGLGLGQDLQFNTLAWALAENGGPSNPVWSTRVLRWLTANPDFRRDFINRYVDLLNTQFEYQPLFDEFQSKLVTIGPEIDRHMERWYFPANRWSQQITVVGDFLAGRSFYARQHLVDEFGLGATHTLELAVDPPGAGAISLTAIRVDSLWRGEYFEGNPVTLRAEAEPGFHFLAWSDGDLPPEPEILVDLLGDSSLTALFAEGGPDVPYALINEINYRSYANTALPAANPAQLLFARPFPNPFNPRTTFRFHLPVAGRVKLEVFDIRGRRVVVPVDGVLPSGWRRVDWRAESLPSGVYLARLVTDAGTRTRKLALIR